MAKQGGTAKVSYCAPFALEWVEGVFRALLPSSGVCQQLRSGGSDDFQFETAEEGEQTLIEIAGGKRCATAC
jgi:hypothetical protein